MSATAEQGEWLQESTNIVLLRMVELTSRSFLTTECLIWPILTKENIIKIGLFSDQEGKRIFLFPIVDDQVGRVSGNLHISYHIVNSPFQ